MVMVDCVVVGFDEGGVFGVFLFLVVVVDVVVFDLVGCCGCFLEKVVGKEVVVVGY